MFAIGLTVPDIVAIEGREEDGSRAVFDWAHDPLADYPTAKAGDVTYLCSVESKHK